MADVEPGDLQPISAGCGGLLLLALLLTPYALARHGWACWRERRAVRRG